MLRKVLTALLCGFAIAGQMRAQEVVVARETKADTLEQGAPASERTNAESGTSTEAKSQVRKKKSPSAALTLEQMRMAGALAAERLKGRIQEAGTAGGASSQTPAAETRNASGAAERVKKETRVEQTDASRASNSRTTQSEAVGPIRPTMIESGKQEPSASPAAKTEARGQQTPAPQSANRSLRRQETILSQLPNKPSREEDTIPAQSINLRTETAFTKLATGFDFPVGIPDAQGYYKARGFRPHGHLGEDWDGTRGGDTDLGDPIYGIGDGVVVFARDCHMGWGNVIIVRHAYREDGIIKSIDSLYGHLDSILVRPGQAVSRGQKIGTVGTAHGLYDAHLHLEIRKNIEIGMSRAAFARDFSNYYDPSQFILMHRNLQSSRGKYRIAMNTFTHDALINWDAARNYSHHRGGAHESAAALKKALVSESADAR
jgi:murein DD-endopeptidase MepM/ murein hydrolase activator NlpD